jgi:hypothetical protein
VHPAPVRLLAASGIAALALAGVTTSVAIAAPSAAAAAITGGHTTIALSHKTLNALDNNGISIHATGAATLKNDNLRLPIRGGQATPPNYVIHYKGGFEYTDGSHSVKVSHIVINTAKHQGTAEVGSLGRIKALHVGDPNGGNGDPGDVQFGGFKVTFTKTGYQALDSIMNTKVFENHPRLGVGTTHVKYTA